MWIFRHISVKVLFLSRCGIKHFSEKQRLRGVQLHGPTALMLPRNLFMKKFVQIEYGMML